MVQSLPMVQLRGVWVVDCCFNGCILKRRIRLLYYSYRGSVVILVQDVVVVLEISIYMARAEAVRRCFKTGRSIVENCI